VLETRYLARGCHPRDRRGAQHTQQRHDLLLCHVAHRRPLDGRQRDLLPDENDGAFGSPLDNQRGKERDMGKLVVTEFISLDGVFEDPGGAEDYEHGGWTF
jgi:hypothetical protein